MQSKKAPREHGGRGELQVVPRHGWHRGCVWRHDRRRAEETGGGPDSENCPARIVVEHVLQWWEGKVPRAMGNKNFLAVIWGGPRLHRGKEPTGAGLPSLRKDSLISSTAGEWLKGPCGPGKTHLKDRQESLTPHPNFILVSWRPWSSIWEYGWESSKKTWSYISTKPEG